MKMKKKVYVALVVLVVAGGSYYWYKKSNSSSTAPVYKTAVAEKGTLKTAISGSGNVIVDNSSTVDPTISGTVTNLSVEIGDQVKKGQLLFVIDNDQLGVSAARAAASYAQSKDAVNSAKYSKKQADADYEANPKKINKDKVELAKEQISLAEQSVAVSLADYRRQLADANKRNVVSPIDGTVNAINIKNGDDLARLSSSSNSSAPIIIGDLNTLKAQVQVNEIDIANVLVDQKVMLKFSAIDELSVSGKVEKVDSLGTLSSGVVTYNVTIGFDTIDPRIKSGMSVSASIITAVKKDILLVPSGAIKTKNRTSYVEVLKDGQEKLTEKDVKIGLSDNTNTEILSGIEAGEKVVTQTITSETKASAGTSSSSRGGIGIPGLGR